MSLPLFTLKTYQIQTLASLRQFLEETTELNDADTAFYAVTKRPFTPPPGLRGLQSPRMNGFPPATTSANAANAAIREG